MKSSTDLLGIGPTFDWYPFSTISVPRRDNDAFHLPDRSRLARSSLKKRRVEDSSGDEDSQRSSTPAQKRRGTAQPQRQQNIESQPGPSRTSTNREINIPETGREGSSVQELVDACKNSTPSATRSDPEVVAMAAPLQPQTSTPRETSQAPSVGQLPYNENFIDVEDDVLNHPEVSALELEIAAKTSVIADMERQFEENRKVSLQWIAPIVVASA